MHELDDIALLEEYVERDSEEAFAVLVARHVNKVYSVALRHTGNPLQAEEITQAVFVILARKSHILSKQVVLSGWLYQTARFTAVTFIRSEARRVRREQEAHMQNLSSENDSEVWSQIGPLLDEAMARLSETDRHALVLRYFDGMTMKEVGAVLGGSEDAAKMRVNRAVEKLRIFFSKRGVVVPATTLATVILANSVQAAPAALTKTAIAAAAANAASGSTTALVNGALKLMAWTKTKITLAVTAAAILTAGVSTVTVNLIRPTTVNFSGQRVTVLAEFDWRDVAAKGELAGGKVMKMNGKTVLKIVGATNGVALPLLKIEKPSITAMHYAIIGEIKCENVENGGHVNMWSFFPPLRRGSPEPQYASSAGELGVGPAASFQGTADWRAFWLTLDRTGKTYPESFVPPMDTVVTLRPPTRLEVGIFLGSLGTAYVRDLKLVQWKSQPNAAVIGTR